MLGSLWRTRALGLLCCRRNCGFRLRGGRGRGCPGYWVSGGDWLRGLVLEWREGSWEGEGDEGKYYLPPVDPDYEVVPGLDGDFGVFVAQDLEA